MAAEQLGQQGLPTAPPTENYDWIRGVGETRQIEFRGERNTVKSRYESLKNEVGIAALNYQNAEGRARLMGRFVRTDSIGGGQDGVTIVEELHGIDIVRSIFAAPLWADLDDDDIAEVAAAVEARLPEAEIDGYADWGNTKKELRWQMLHGQDSYFETVFALRIRKQGVRSSALQGVFANINTVVPVPTLSAGMAELVGTLPDGEWLYKPPQVEYVRRGVWSVSSEWNWSAAWSVMYGGSKKGFLNVDPD